jgi:hypothetical protein
MTIVPHAIVGASTAVLTNNIYSAFLLGVIGHFVTDALPHLEPKALVKKSLDGAKVWSPWLFVFVGGEFLLTIFIFSFLFHRSDFLVLVSGAFGGLLPDIIVNNPFLQKYRNAPVLKYLFLFHGKIHLDMPTKYWYISLIIEGAIVGGSIWLLLKF